MKHHRSCPDRFRFVPEGLRPRAGRIYLIDPSPGVEAVFDAPEHDLILAHSGLVDAMLLARIAPDTIVAPLVGRHHDILELSQTLMALDFRGLLCGVSLPPLTPRLVINEIRALGAPFAFCVLERIG